MSSTIRFSATSATHRELSNFYPFTPFSNHDTPFNGFDDNVLGLHFPSSEHYYQFQKYYNYNHPLAKVYALNVLLDPPKSALAVKQRAKRKEWVTYLIPEIADREERTLRFIDEIDQLTTYTELVWNGIRVQTMKRALELKFNLDTNPEMAQFLIDTYPHPLAELDDRFGNCSFWSEGGENMLGILLMQVRDELMRISMID